VPGFWEDGPRYDCAGCGGSGDGRDFVRLRDKREARYLIERLVMCSACNHHALDHYDGVERCAWEADDLTAVPWNCACTLSRESVLALAETQPEVTK
jgi:hypothetical protein